MPEMLRPPLPVEPREAPPIKVLVFLDGRKQHTEQFHTLKSARHFAKKVSAGRAVIAVSIDGMLVYERAAATN